MQEGGGVRGQVGAQWKDGKQQVSQKAVVLSTFNTAEVKGCPRQKHCPAAAKPLERQFKPIPPSLQVCPCSTTVPPLPAFSHFKLQTIKNNTNAWNNPPTYDPGVPNGCERSQLCPPAVTSQYHTLPHVSQLAHQGVGRRPERHSRSNGGV